MITIPPTHRQRDPAATLPRPRVDATLCLSTRTLAWLVPRPLDLSVVESVWKTLAELEAAGHSARLVAAVRFVLIHHEPTRAGRCRACRRASLAQSVAASPVSLRGVAPNPRRAARTPHPQQLRPTWHWQECFPMKPSTAEEVDWLALSLVSSGEVIKDHQTYLKGGHPLPAWLLPDLLFEALVADGLLALTPSNNKGLARVLLTDTGRTRYAQLCQGHQGHTVPAACSH